MMSSARQLPDDAVGGGYGLSIHLEVPPSSWTSSSALYTLAGIFMAGEFAPEPRQILRVRPPEIFHNISAAARLVSHKVPPTTSLSALQPPQNALVPGNIICSNRPWNPWLHGASLQTTGDTSDQPDLSTDFRQHSPRSFHPQLRGRAGILLHMVLRWIWRCGRCIASIPSPVCKVSTINIHEK